MGVFHKVLLTILIIYIAILVGTVLNLAKAEEIVWANGFDMFKRINQECTAAISNGRSEGLYSENDAVVNYYFCMQSGYEHMYKNAKEIVEHMRAKI